MTNLILPVVLFSISSSITPGPNNVMLMTSSVNHGIKKTLPHYLGVCLGFPLMLLITGLGLAGLLTHYPIIHETIKILGAAYMLYLAWKIAASHKSFDKVQSKPPLTFLQAVLFQWANPKAWSMGLGAISAYTSLVYNLTHQIIMIVLLFLIIIFPCGALWMMFGVSLKRFLKNDQHQRYFNWCMGALLAISILLVFIE